MSKFLLPATLTSFAASALWLGHGLTQYEKQQLQGLGSTAPRGFVNKNPGNIRISSANWKGKVTPSRDPDFEQFKSYSYGIRAIMVLISTYITKHNLDTLSKVINRYAPPSENDTQGYIRYVSNITGIPPHAPLVNTVNVISRITAAIINKEIGTMWAARIPKQEYDKAINLYQGGSTSTSPNMGPVVIIASIFAASLAIGKYQTNKERKKVAA